MLIVDTSEKPIIDRDSLVFTAECFDPFGTDDPPLQVFIQVIDPKRNVEITPEYQLPSELLVGALATINITDDENTLDDEEIKSGKRRVLIRAVFGPNNQKVDYAEYTVSRATLTPDS